MTFEVNRKILYISLCRFNHELRLFFSTKSQLRTILWQNCRKIKVKIYYPPIIYIYTYIYNLSEFQESSNSFRIHLKVQEQVYISSRIFRVREEQVITISVSF